MATIELSYTLESVTYPLPGMRATRLSDSWLLHRAYTPRYEVQFMEVGRDCYAGTVRDGAYCLSFTGLTGAEVLHDVLSRRYIVKCS